MEAGAIHTGVLLNERELKALYKLWNSLSGYFRAHLLPRIAEDSEGKLWIIPEPQSHKAEPKVPSPAAQPDFSLIHRKLDNILDEFRRLK